MPEKAKRTIHCRAKRCDEKAKLNTRRKSDMVSQGGIPHALAARQDVSFRLLVVARYLARMKTVQQAKSHSANVREKSSQARKTRKKTAVVPPLVVYGLYGLAAMALFLNIMASWLFISYTRKLSEPLSVELAPVSSSLPPSAGWLPPGADEVREAELPKPEVPAGRDDLAASRAKSEPAAPQAKPVTEKAAAKEPQKRR